eukprot:XP_001708546.1 Hypothetical protein GL50803_4917 [Giardia lamblia ATCC 50803]
MVKTSFISNVACVITVITTNTNEMRIDVRTVFVNIPIIIAKIVELADASRYIAIKRNIFPIDFSHNSSGKLAETMSMAMRMGTKDQAV